MEGNLNNKKLLQKEITCIIVLLLIILSFSSIITANIKINDDLIEITTEFFGINKIESSAIKLTYEEYANFEKYINEFKNKLENIRDRAEIIGLFKEAIVEFDKYGLLADLNIEKAQDLVIKNYQNQKMIKFSNNNLLFQDFSEDINNSLCFIAGQTTNTFFQTPFFSSALVGILPLQLIVTIFFILLFANIFLILSIIIVSIMTTLGSLIGRFLDFIFLNQPIMFGSNIWLANSDGWIFTMGLQGIKSNQGIFNGKITGKGLFYEMGKAWIFGYAEPYEPIIGARGFTGLRLNIDAESFESFYIGTALRVNVCR